MGKFTVKYLDYIIYWTIVLLPFSISIANAPMNVFMGLLIISFLAKKILKKEWTFVRTAINLPLLLLFIITCLSVFNSVNFRDSLRGGILRLFQYILVLFAIAEELKDQKQIKRIVFSIGAGLILASVDEIWQVASGRDFIRGYATIVNIGLLRATASFKDSNTLGIYLSAIAPLIFGLTLYYFKGIKRIALIFVSFIALIGIALTYSRPTLLATYVAIFFLGLARRSKFLVAILIIFTLVSPFLLPKSVKDWAKAVDYNPIRFMCNDDRIAVYLNSLNMIKDHPLIGLGANTYMKNYKKYKGFPEYHNIVTLDYMYAHNNFLHMAAEIGLVGLGIFIYLLYKLFRGCANIYKRLDEHFLKVILLSLSACLIAFLINGLTESSLYSSRVAIIFWYITGFSLALDKFAHADRK